MNENDNELINHVSLCLINNSVIMSIVQRIPSLSHFLLCKIPFLCFFRVGIAFWIDSALSVVAAEPRYHATTLPRYHLPRGNSKRTRAFFFSIDYIICFPFISINLAAIHFFRSIAKEGNGEKKFTQSIPYILLNQTGFGY